jgi:hypothetical protein
MLTILYEYNSNDSIVSQSGEMAVGKDKVWMCVWRMECLDAKTIIMNIFLISFGRRVR